MIGVTGATGRLSGWIARRLAAAGAAQRLLARDPSRAPRLPGAEAVRAEFADTEAVRAALDGVSTYTAIANGEVAGVTDDVPRLTGHPATSLTELLRRGGSAY